MIRNYLKIALRNLARQKALSFINIAGLSIGLACFTLFLLFAVNQFSYDRFHTNAPQIYRVAEWVEGVPDREPGGEPIGNILAGPAFKTDFPDVENFVRIQTSFEDKLIRANDKVSRCKLSFADPQLLSVFSFPIVNGNNNALKDPHSIVLTEDRAIALFGSTNIIGKRVEIKVEDEFEPFTVAAVMGNIPDNSSISFSVMGSFDYLLSTKMGKEASKTWQMQIGATTFLQLKAGSKLMEQPDRIAAFRKKYYPEEEAGLKKEGMWSGSGPLPISFRLQPLRDIHTNPKINGGMTAGMDPKYIWILIAIAGGILLIACINFTTLAIGRSAGRAKEVGVRKVMGGQRRQLVYQFLTESFLLSVLSALFAILLAKLLLPFFNQLSGVSISFSFSRYPEMIALMAGLVLITGLMAGIYPALILSGFRPVEVLKSKIRLGGSNIFTKSLVTLQFVLSISLIIATAIILQQLKFMQSKNIGLNKENVVVVNAEGTDAGKIYPLVREALRRDANLIGIAGSEMGLGEGTGLMGTAFDNKGEMKGVILYPVDAGYLKTMGMQLIAGRDFDPSLSIDTVQSVIVNEVFLREFGLTVDNAIGKQVMEKQWQAPDIPRTIIGIARNFNFSSLTENVRAQLFYQPPVLNARHLFVRIKPGDPSKSIASIKAAWKKVVPDLPFQYSFLDENFNRFYRTEQRWGNIVGSAGMICILLACLGLFGLAALAAVNRTKEIGIRKVLGASVSSIVGLLSRDFLKLVIIALLIAVPLTWWGMHRWLQDYAYRINIGWLVFAITGISALAIAFFTVGLRALRTAISNPVKSLRSE